MVLGSEAIRQLGYAGVIAPFAETNVQPASYDVTLGNEFLFGGQQVVIPDGERLALEPGDFCLGYAVEKLTLGTDIAAQLDGRSTWGRKGLAVHWTAGWIDPGFRGQITLELMAAAPLELTPGDTVAQLVFFPVIGDADPYNGRYQGQNGVTGPR